jgi:hypothetical protein
MPVRKKQQLNDHEFRLHRIQLVQEINEYIFMTVVLLTALALTFKLYQDFSSNALLNSKVEFRN